MPMLKTMHGGKERSCEGICNYLMLDERTGEIRSRDCHLQNLSAVNLMWGNEMDMAREVFASKLRKSGSPEATRKYYHFILSPDPADAVSVDECMDYAKEWLEANFPEDHFQAAIVIHDDNKRRIADGGDGIVHAHVIVNPVEITTGRRIQIAKDRKRRRQIERGELGPEYVHEDILADSAQRLAQIRNWHAFENEGHDYKKNHRATSVLKEVQLATHRDLICTITQEQADALSLAFDGAGISAELLEENGQYVFSIPTQDLSLAQQTLDKFIEQTDSEAVMSAMQGERILAIASARFDEHAEFLTEALAQAGITFTSQQCEAHTELTFNVKDAGTIEDVCQRLIQTKALDAKRLLNAEDAFAAIELPQGLRSQLTNYKDVFEKPVTSNQSSTTPNPERLTSAEVAMRGRGEFGWKDTLRANIESAAKRSQTEKEMKYRLGSAGIKVREWSGGYIYTDAQGHTIRDSVLGAGYTRKAVWAMYMEISWGKEAEEKHKKTMRESTLYYCRLIVREDSHRKEVKRELKLINELEMVLVRENINSWDDLNAAEDAVKKMGTDLRIELQKLGPDVDRARALIDTIVDMRYYKEFADDYESMLQIDPNVARDYYSSFGIEIDSYGRLLASIENDFGLRLDQLDAALAQANAVSQHFLDIQAAFDGTARRLSDIRTARDRARWVHNEVERRAAQEKIARGDMSPALRDIANQEKKTPKAFYKKERSPYWVLNMTKDTYKKNAERNRAARANFKRTEPTRYKTIPAYIKRDEQIKRSQIEQMRRNATTQSTARPTQRGAKGEER